MRKRMVRGVASLVVMVSVVIGVPLVLVRIGRLDALAIFGVPGWWSHPDDGSVVFGVITLIAWIAWGLFVLSLADEAISAYRPARHARPRIWAFWSPVTVLLITAAAGLVAGELTDPQSAAAQVAPADPAARGRLAGAEEDPVRPPGGKVHRVQAGDDLWTLAERYLGEGTRWREIAAANADILQGGTDIDIGMVLVIPDSGSEPSATKIVVRQGDTLASLAASHLGDASRWQELWQANAELISDPDLVQPGWRLALPSDAVGPAETVLPEPGDPADDPTGLSPEESGGQDQNLPGTESPRPVQPTDGSDLDIAYCPVEVVTSGDDNQSGDSAGFDPTPVGMPTANEMDQDRSGEQGAETAGQHRPARLGAPPDAVAILAASGISLTLAASALAAYRWRRRQQEAVRPLGRRMPHLGAEADDFRGLLATADGQESPALTGWRVEVGFDGERDVLWEFTDPITRVCGEGAQAFLSALAARVASAESGPDVLLLGDDFTWLASMDEPRLGFVEAPLAQEQLDHEIATRRRALAELGSRAQLPDLLVIADQPLEASDDLPALAMRLICIDEQGRAPCLVVGANTAMAPSGERFVPTLLRESARRAWSEAFAVAGSGDYPQAWWWEEDSPQHKTARRGEEATVIERTKRARGGHPMLMLLGPVELVGARGKAPNRAVRQCEEYCAWLLENPGASSAAMASRLVVAETTRRSNMSRLRTWLGKDDTGQAYLPEAYSGSIRLHPGITSDWEELRAMVCMGVNRAADSVLESALGMVRGAPLANTAPGQWVWAESLRLDMAAVIRDIGVVLASRKIDQRDLVTAEWALTRAEWASPGDELITAQRLRLAQANNDHEAVHTLILELTRHAKTTGVDLSDETVTIMQQVVEGRARVRA